MFLKYSKKASRFTAQLKARLVKWRSSSKFLFALIYFLTLLFPLPLNQGFLVSQLEKILSESLGFKTTIGLMQLIDNNQLVLSNVLIRDLESDIDPVIVNISRIHIDYHLPDLLKSQIRSLKVYEPKVFLTPERLKKIQAGFKPQVAVEAAKRDLDIDERQIENSKRGFLIENIMFNGGQVEFLVDKKIYTASDFFLQVKDLSKDNLSDLDVGVGFSLNKVPSGRLRYSAKTISFTNEDIVQGTLTLEQFDLSLVMSILASNFDVGLAKGKWGGKIDLEAKTPSRSLPTEWRLHAGGLDYESPDGTHAFQGFGLNAVVNTTVAGEKGQRVLTTSLKGELKGGPLLWGPYYHDFSGQALSIHGTSVLNWQKTVSGEFSVKSTNLGKVNTQFKQTGVTQTVNIQGHFPSLNRLYANGLGALLKVKAPESFGEEIPEGDLHADLALTRTNGKLGLITGTIRGNDMRYATPKKAFVTEGAQLAANFDLAVPPSGFLLTIRKGRLAWDRFQWNNLQFGGGEILAELKKNRAVLTKPVRSELARGVVEIKSLIIEDILHPFKKLQSAFEIKNINFFWLSQQLGLFPFVGSLEATFPSVSFENGLLQTEGKILAKAFQGHWSVDQIHGQGFGTPAMEWGFSAKGEYVNMGLLSQLSNFGYITGVLNMQAKDVLVRQGSLAKFDLDVGTLLDSGIKYEVGIEAVRKITIFAGGLSALKFLDQGIYRMIDTYGYEGLGGRFTLSDQLLSARAHFERDGKKLFLKGRGVPRLDIVYNEGGGAISWPAFLQQLKSVELKLKEKEQ